MAVQSTLAPPRLRAALAAPAGRRRATVAAFALAALAVGAYLVWLGHGNTFFFDEWAWIVRRRSGLHAILSSYNGQTMILSTAAYQLLFHTVGLRDYWVFRLIAVLVHLAAAAVAFVYVRRRIGAAALLAIVPFLVLGDGWENILWSVNSGFVAAMALSVGALLALERDSRHADLIALGLLIAALLCSELAVMFALGVAVELTWRERSLRRAYVWLAPGVLYGCWLIAYYQPLSLGLGIGATPDFAARLAAGALGGLLGFDSSWDQALAVAVVILGAMRLARLGRLTPRLAALLVTAAAYWLAVAYDRARLGDPTAPRYVYVGALLLILIGSELLRGVRARAGWVAAAALLALFSLIANVHALQGAEDGLRSDSRIARAELGALDLARAQVSPALLIDSRYMPGVTAGEYFAATRALGSDPADSPGEIAHEPPAARAAADTLLVHAGELRARALPAAAAAHLEAAARGPGATPLAAPAAAGTVTRAGRCVRFTPRGAGGVLQLSVPAGGLLLAAAPGGSVALFPRRFALTSGAIGLPPLAGGRAVLLRALPDSSPRPWFVQASASAPLTACAA